LAQESCVIREFKKVNSAYGPRLGHHAGAYPGFYSMKRLAVFLLPPGWDASPLQVSASIKFVNTHLLYTPGWREAL